MITPVWALTIDKLCERKNDLLMSADDIKESARNERNKAIDEFTERLKTTINENYFFAGEFKNWKLRAVDEIAEEMKGETEVMEEKEIIEKMRKEDRLLKESDVTKAVQKALIEMGYEPFEEKVMGVYTAIENVSQVCTVEEYDALRENTAYDVEKVVAELEEAKGEIALNEDDLNIYCGALDDAINIVRRGGVE